MRYWLIGALALALVACDDGGSTEPGDMSADAGMDAGPTFDVDSGPFAEAFATAPAWEPDRVEMWTPDPCPTEAWTTPEVFGSEERVLVTRAQFLGLGTFTGAEPGDRVRHAGEEFSVPVPTTWEPEIGPGECVGTTYQYVRESGEVVAGGRVIVVAE